MYRKEGAARGRGRRGLPSTPVLAEAHQCGVMTTRPLGYRAPIKVVSNGMSALCAAVQVVVVAHSELKVLRT